MKELIIMSAMIMLGVFIYNLIAGGGDDSLINSLSDFFKSEIETRSGLL